MEQGKQKNADKYLQVRNGGKILFDILFKSE